MSKLESLLEQTSFLLERQVAARTDGDRLFAELLVLIENKMKETRDEEDRESLENIYDAISGEAQKFSDDAADDIEFLKDQLNALTVVKETSDPAKAKDLLASIIDEEEEIQDTASFKKDVLDEAELSRQNLFNIISDFKSALEEGNVKDLELTINSMISAEDEDFDDEDFEDDDMDDEEEDTCCCSSKKSCCNDGKKSGCCGGKK